VVSLARVRVSPVVLRSARRGDSYQASAWTGPPRIPGNRPGSTPCVEDGHHRVSIARATRQKMIDAYVTEVLTARPAAAAKICAPCVA
jgi:hypothetical protein